MWFGNKKSAFDEALFSLGGRFYWRAMPGT
jgi:hypothetical protein